MFRVIQQSDDDKAQFGDPEYYLHTVGSSSISSSMGDFVSKGCPLTNSPSNMGTCQSGAPTGDGRTRELLLKKNQSLVLNDEGRSRPHGPPRRYGSGSSSHKGIWAIMPTGIDLGEAVVKATHAGETDPRAKVKCTMKYSGPSAYLREYHDPASDASLAKFIYKDEDIEYGVEGLTERDAIELYKDAEARGWWTPRILSVQGSLHPWSNSTKQYESTGRPFMLDLTATLLAYPI